MVFDRLRCAVSGHDLPVRDNVEDTPVWRCPRCWQTRERERVLDPRPVRPLDARFVIDPDTNAQLRRDAVMALRAAAVWRARASTVARRAQEAVVAAAPTERRSRGGSRRVVDASLGVTSASEWADRVSSRRQASR